jgi:hypothetical protein
MSPIGSAAPELPDPRDGSDGRSVNLVVLVRGSARVGYPPGLMALVLCLVLAYVGLELISYWEMMGKAVVAVSIVSAISSGMLLTRAGLLNPWKRMSEWQRQHLLEWKERAWNAERYVDRVACAWIGTKDTDDARQRVNERVVRFEQGRRRGRPPGTPSGITREKSLEIAADIRRLTDDGYSLPRAARSCGVSVEAARNYLSWLDSDEKNDQL